MSKFRYTLLIGLLSLLSFNMNGQSSSNISLVYHWQDTTFPQGPQYEQTYNEIWGFVQGGKEYAVIGSGFGTHIFDVTTTGAEYQVDFVPGAHSDSTVVHRDYHDYNGYLYAVCDEGPSSLQIIDLQYLPDSVHLVYDQQTFFTRAHNIFIDTAHGVMYTASQKHISGNDPVVSYSLSNPTNPVMIHQHVMPGGTHDLYVWNDTMYAHDGNAGFDMFTNAKSTSPVFLGSYVSPGYNHSGWLDRERRVYYNATETHGVPIKAFDVSDPANISTISNFACNSDTSTIVHNLMYKDNLLFASYYYDGMYVFDVSDPANPAIAGYYDTYPGPNTHNFRGCWGVYCFLPSGKILASDMQSGLYVFDISQITTVMSHRKVISSVTIHPNPSNGFFSFDTKNIEPEVLELYSVTGKLLERQRLVPNQTSVLLEESISSGVYLLKFISGQNSVTEKLVVKR